MKKYSSRYLLTGLIIAWAVDLLFFNKPFGVAFSVWISLALLLLFILGFIEKVKPAGQTIFLALLSFLFSLGAFFRLEPLTRFLSSSASFLLLMLTAATYRHGYWWWFRIVDYVSQLLKLFAAAFTQAWELVFPSKDTQVSEKIDSQLEKASKTGKPIWSIVRGIALALPVILILSALLASADPIFNQGIQKFLELFKIENLAEYLFRFFYILLFAYLFSGVLLYALNPPGKQQKPDPNKPFIKTFLGNTETSVVLAMVNILFLVFLIVQFRYFFGGQSNISATGFTYSEYARKGFNELVMVAVISVLLYLALNTITTRKSSGQTRLFSWLAGLLFIQVLVILFSGFQRLALYEAAYGFSRLRTYSTLFIPWLAALILALIILEIIQRQSRVALVLLFGAVGFVATLVFVNVDGFIAGKNIERATLSSQEGYALDYNYLLQLSNDALPVILRASQSSNPVIAEPSTASLVCRWHQFSRQEKVSWQGFNYSDHKAFSLLAARQTTWQKYTVIDPGGYNPLYVKIGTKTYSCSPDNSDWLD